jgi:hypothetical protein
MGYPAATIDAYGFGYVLMSPNTASSSHMSFFCDGRLPVLFNADRRVSIPISTLSSSLPLPFFTRGGTLALPLMPAMMKEGG